MNGRYKNSLTTELVASRVYREKKKNDLRKCRPGDNPEMVWRNFGWAPANLGHPKQFLCQIKVVNVRPCTNHTISTVVMCLARLLRPVKFSPTNFKVALNTYGIEGRYYLIRVIVCNLCDFFTKSKCSLAVRNSSRY